MRRPLPLLVALALSTAAQAQTWTSIGPAPTTGFSGATGRVSAIATSRVNASLFYAAGADGGIWRTTDGGATWTPLTDGLPTTAMGALVLDPADENTIYAGSGEANFANHSRHGLGLYKSTDAGAHWTVLAAPTFAGRCFSKIVIDPTNTQTLYASITQPGGFPQRAAAKNHPGATGPRGVFRSTDGGQTWTRFENLPDLCATDLALDPQNPSTIYAAIGHIFGNAANGIYKSTDAGANWTRLTGGLPTTQVGRITLAVAPSQPSRVYTLVTRLADEFGNNATALGAFRSDNAGATWTSLPASIDQSTYGWYLSVVAVHPTNPDIAFFGGLNLLRYNAGTFSTVTPPHVDQHGIAFDSAGAVLAACDGGVYRSTDLGNSWVNRNSGLCTTQFYAGLSTSPTDDTYCIGGLQDNGTNRRVGNTIVWSSTLGGDGGWTQLNPSNPQIVFAEFQGTGNLYRSTNGGASFSVSSSGITGRNAFFPPYLIDPANNSRMIYGAERLFLSTNGGGNWSAFSPDLTGGGTAAIRALAYAPSNSGLVYAATNDGRVLSSTNGGSTFTLRLTDAGLWPRLTRELTVDPADPLTVYLAGWTYGPAPRLRRSRDGGATWQSIDSGLPDIPVNVVAIDPRQSPPAIFVGTDDGVYRSVNDAATFRRYGAGTELPHTPVVDLILEPARDRLLAGTQGRGAWTAPLAYCYPDINDDGFLNILDFNAFANAFAAGSLQANCDGSTVEPVLNVLDFNCFINRFSAGCP